MTSVTSVRGDVDLFHARVGHDDVDLAELGHGGVVEVDDAVHLRHIGRVHQRLHTVRFGRLFHLFGGGRVAGVVDDHVGALLRQPQHDGPAQAFR
ncbi:hypothetical protein QRX50_17060 [Amycolatopsis carbonis]|uniref:Uncharacterized protein n=1 Tax=Amycolatopsis carbonis TaxID=715471 RepID=A0A9Y2IPX5_9PSEU|nr:hypothetical protein [Amycolatopsis sp. 2-15]WIX82348.1 hypothetical protein QRX50_17060 [Amycolatopsis sp. 2-15]